MGRSKKERMWRDISIYIGGRLPMRWWVGASSAKKEHTLRAPDRYITFSSASGGERGDGAIEQELVDVDGRLDGR